MQGDIFYPLRGNLFGFSKDFSIYKLLLPVCPVCRTVPGVLICQPQAVRFFNKSESWTSLAVGILKFPFDGKVYPLGWGNSHVYSLSVWLFIYQSARGVYYTNHLCWKSVLALCAQFSNTVCKVFLSRTCLEAPFTRAQQFPL